MTRRCPQPNHRKRRASSLSRIARATLLVFLAALGPASFAQETTASAEAKESGKDEKQQNEAAEVAEEEAGYYDLLEPSNTGYIDDAVVGHKLRVRFDSASGISKPDRAEFLYGKCLCFDKLFGQDAASPGPGENLDLRELELAYELPLGRRFSLFVEVPFRSIDLTIHRDFVQLLDLESSKVETNGLGDTRAGFKLALLARKSHHLTFQLRGYFATGESKDALGTNHDSIEPGLLYLARPSKRLSIASELRWWHPLDGSSDPLTGASAADGIRREAGASPLVQPPGAAPIVDAPVRNGGYAGDILRFGIGASYEDRGARMSAAGVAELVGWHVLDGYAFTGDLFEADGDTIVNLKLGARLSGQGANSWYLGYGFPLTGEDWYDGVWRLEYRHNLARAGGSSRSKQRSSRVQSEAAAMDRPTDRAATAAEAAQAARALEVRERERLEAARALAHAAAARHAAAAEVAAIGPEEEVLAAVRRWSESWSEQRLDAYLGSYAESFQPVNGMSRPAWEAWRQQRLTAPRFIEISITEAEVTLEAPDRAGVSFVQRYASNTYRDTVRKRLGMVLEAGAWKIASENAIAVQP